VALLNLLIYLERNNMTETFNYETFAGQLNTKFALPDASQPFELELVEVTEPKITASQTFFSLFFLGNPDLLLPQGSYRLNHGQLGEMTLFLVPVERDQGGFKYEAVFNLLN
jgi:hypothetical protein